MIIVIVLAIALTILCYALGNDIPSNRQWSNAYHQINNDYYF
jgi:hypothetical protein